MSDPRPEIAEVERLLSSVTFISTKLLLEEHLVKLKKAAKLLDNLENNEPVSAPLTSITHLPVPGPEPNIVKKPVVIPTTGNFINIADFAWDQGEYNTPTVSVFIDLEDVGSVKERVHVSFSKSSFDLTVIDLKGKSYRLLKNNLEKDIVPEQSTFIVKKNKLVIKLRKVKGEYSFDQWTTLTNKKNKEETEKTKKDPMGGICFLKACNVSDSNSISLF
jgi:calcyclin binding protein